MKSNPYRMTSGHMKSNPYHMTSGQYKALQMKVYNDGIAQISDVIKLREEMAGCRAQWMLMVAIMRRYGHKGRWLLNVFAEIGEMLPELYQNRKDEALDGLLISELERNGFDVHKHYKEYFEAEDKLFRFGKETEALKEERKAKSLEEAEEEVRKRREMVLGKRNVLEG